MQLITEPPAAIMPPGTHFYVHSPQFQPAEPLTADHIARGIAAGKIPESALVAQVGATSWTAIESVDEIVEALRVAKAVRPPIPVAPTRRPPTPAPVIAVATPVVGPIAAALAPVPAAVAPVPAPAAQPAVALVADAAVPAPVAAKPEDKKADDKKPEEKKPVLDPKYKTLPLKIFGACCAVGLLETIIALLAR